MKKIFSISIGLFMCFNATAQTYLWENSYEPLKINKVKFHDGSEMLIKEERTQETDARAIFIKRSQTKEFVKTRYADDYAYLSVAYPSPDNATVAVFTLSCAGNACHGSNIVVAYVYQNKLVISELDTVFNPEAGLTFNLKGKELVQAKANYLDIGETNELDDVILRNRALLLGKGFIDNRFKEKLIPLIDVHPAKFFEDKNARSKLLKKIGNEEFKELRNSINVAFNTEVHMGRYITFIGCMAHNCYDVNGIVVLDSFDGEAWALHANKETKISKYYGTKPLNLNIEYLIRDSLASQYELKTIRKNNSLAIEFQNQK